MWDIYIYLFCVFFILQSENEKNKIHIMAKITRYTVACTLYQLKIYPCQWALI